MEENEEIMRCDKEGYFDLDSLKPYSSVWVSTRRDVRSKSHSQDEDSDTKKNVMPSRACNNLHSLLETTGSGYNNDPSEEEVKKQTQQQLSSTKSDHFPLNPYKIFEKGDSVSLRKISDKIIESMCKSESKVLFNETESVVNGSSSSKKQMVGSKSKEKLPSEKPLQIQHEQVNEDDQKTEKNDFGEAEENHCQTFKKLQMKSDEEKINVEPSKPSHYGSGEPQKEPNKDKLLSENGKLVAEINLASLTLKDHSGREYPVQVKYVWETDVNEVTNAADRVFNTSPGLIKMIESVTSVGMKCDSWLSTSVSTGTKNISWHERTKSVSSSSQAKSRRQEDWNAEDRNSNFNHHSSKGDILNTKKGPLKDTQTIRNAILRSKVSIVGPYQDKKLFDNMTEFRKDTKSNEVKQFVSGIKDGSRINIADRKANQRKYRIPIKKTFTPVDEIRASGVLSRPSTFNKREIVPRLAPNRPPSAPTREITTRLPQRLGVHETGDRLYLSNKRHFGYKLQAPPTTLINKTWK